MTMAAARTRAAQMKIACALAEFNYLTVSQLNRVLGNAPASENRVRKHLRSMVSAELVLSLASQSAILPRIYTLTANGYRLLGLPQVRRVRSSEEQQKAGNLFFLQHTIAVTAVLIGARLLSRTHPEIVLTRMLTERALKRKIYVAVPAGAGGRPVCIEPDASLEFVLQGKVKDFFHIEVYRTLPPAEWRFRQKIQAYVTYATSGLHETLFATPALSIAVFAQTLPMARTLKKWTAEVLQDMNQPEQAVRFFFRSGSVADASPQELFLTPCWEQPLTTTKTPLIIREEADPLTGRA
jgi:protein involved in plasmid replication-relaxation